MSDKIRETLEEAQGVIASNRLVLGEYMGVRYIGELEHKINEVLAEPVDLTYSQEDVNKMTSEMIALRKDYEKLAFKRGVKAMRDAAAQASDLVAMKCRSALAHPHESLTAHGADECAWVIRGLPDPMDDNDA